MTSPASQPCALRPPALGSPDEGTHDIARSPSSPRLLADRQRHSARLMMTSPSPHTSRLAETLQSPWTAPSSTWMQPSKSWQESVTRELLARQSFAAVFEGFRRLYPARPGQTVAVFKVTRSQMYERTGLYGDQEYTEGAEFLLEPAQAAPDIQERVKALSPGAVVQIVYQHSHLEVAGERYPERLVTQFSVMEPDLTTADGSKPYPERAVSSTAVGAVVDAAGAAQRLTSTEQQQQHQQQQPSPSPARPDRFDNAVAAYGIQLKSWVDHQVEVCLAPWHQQLQNFEGEVLAARRELLSLGAQLKTLSDTQTDTDTRLGAWMGEIAGIKASISVSHATNNAMLEKESGGWASQLTELHRRHGKYESDVSQLQHDHLDLQQNHRDLSEVLSQHRQDHHACISEVRQALDIQSRRVQELDTTTTARLCEFGDSQLEKACRLEAAHATHQELSSQTHNRLNELLASFKSQNEELESSIHVQLDAHLERHPLAHRVESIQQGLEESRLEMLKRLGELQARTTESLEALQVSLLKTFRAELTAAFRSEADAVAALDSQLWRKDSSVLSSSCSPAQNGTIGRLSPEASSKSGRYLLEHASAERLKMRIDNW